MWPQFVHALPDEGDAGVVRRRDVVAQALVVLRPLRIERQARPRIDRRTLDGIAPDHVGDRLAQRLSTSRPGRGKRIGLGAATGRAHLDIAHGGRDDHGRNDRHGRGGGRRTGRQRRRQVDRGRGEAVHAMTCLHAEQPWSNLIALFHQHRRHGCRAIEGEDPVLRRRFHSDPNWDRRAAGAARATGGPGLVHAKFFIWKLSPNLTFKEG